LAARCRCSSRAVIPPKIWLALWNFLRISAVCSVERTIVVRRHLSHEVRRFLREPS
jgi:hypothetical protein